MTESLRLVDDLASQDWDEFICAHGGHLLQSAGWGELKTRFGWNAQRLALERDGKIIAGAQMLFRRLPFGLNLAYIPRGPIVVPSDEGALTRLLDALSDSARQHGAFALKLEPNWLLPPPSSPRAGTREEIRAGLAATPSPAFRSGTPRFLAGGRAGVGVQPRTTIHVDLTPDLDAILARMKPKWRYNIRLADRKGIQVRAGSGVDVPTFHALLRTTGERDRFAIHSLEYYRAAFDLLASHARLLIAEYAGEPVAAIFVTALGAEAIYLYGASSNAHRDRMPNHALHWAAMQWAKTQGCTRYDLWGIPDWADGSTAVPSETAALPQGLYQFKQGFGGQVVRYVGAYDVVFSRLKFVLYTQALRIRKGQSFG